MAGPALDTPGLPLPVVSLRMVVLQHLGAGTKPQGAAGQPTSGLLFVSSQTRGTWGPVMKVGDPSLEHFIFPEVLTLSLTKFSSNEPKGQSHCSVFPCVSPKLAVKTLGPAPSSAQALQCAFGISTALGLLEMCCLRTTNKTICFSFSLFLDCPCLSLQASCVCCVWKGLWFRFSCSYHACPICLRVSRLPWQGVCSSPPPTPEQPLLFTPLLLLTSSASSWLASLALVQVQMKTARDLKILHKHKISVHPLPLLHLLLLYYYHYFFHYCHLFFQYWGWFICTDIWSRMDYCSKKWVNNAAVNYKNEYLKMQPALAEPCENQHFMMWVAVIYDLLIKIPWWRKDAVIGRQERCHIVYGVWTSILVWEAYIYKRLFIRAGQKKKIFDANFNTLPQNIAEKVCFSSKKFLTDL